MFLEPYHKQTQTLYLYIVSISFLFNETFIIFNFIMAASDE